MLDFERLFVRVNRQGEIDMAALPTTWKTEWEVMSIDFETAGNEVYSQNFYPRLCQVSFDGFFAYVLNAWVHREYITELVSKAKKLVVHNGSFDLAILDKFYGIPLEETWWKTDDTQEMGRLLYPTESEKLNDLARKEFDDAVDSDKELKAEFKRLKLTPIGEGYRNVPIDNKIFISYGGLDAIYTFRLKNRWMPVVNQQLLSAEHSMQFQTASMTRRGLLCDVDETKRQIALLDAGIDLARERLEELGIPENVETNQGKEVIGEWLTWYGLPVVYTPVSVANFIEKNDGQLPEGDDLYHCLKTGADTLRLTTMEAPEEVKEVIADLIFIRQAEKIKEAYLYAFLESAEVDGRVHPVIRTMAARTHRWSISIPPLQQIPSHPIEVDIPEHIAKEILGEEWENYVSS